ncbi:MAG: DUF480 domain-containing protein [Steroidobacteraceae bacterium]
MDIRLGDLEARVIGCLIEKEITTPDQYPLSLHALVAACNQKSNRDPVLALDERSVQEAIDALARRHLVVERSGFGSRVPKYQHRLCNTEFGSLRFTEQEVAIVCELLLRGPQTPGELRSRAARMAAFTDSGECERVLEGLAGRSDGPFVLRLAREPGRREARYAHCFAPPPEGSTAPAAQPHAAAPAAAPRAAIRAGAPASQAPGDVSEEAREVVAALERRVAELEERIARLEATRRD